MSGIAGHGRKWVCDSEPAAKYDCYWSRSKKIHCRRECAREGGNADLETGRCIKFKPEEVSRHRVQREVKQRRSSSLSSRHVGSSQWSVALPVCHVRLTLSHSELGAEIKKSSFFILWNSENHSTRVVLYWLKWFIPAVVVIACVLGTFLITLI